ncbi:MAG: CvpA family protein [Oscillospiraceae bacterium]|nr:CvpA family protein [Oscillospiraceae bacterium]
MGINWADLTVVAVLALLAVWGYKRGFFRQLYGLVAFAASALLARLLCSPVASVLSATPIHDRVYEAIYGSDAIQGLSTAAQKPGLVAEALRSLPLPGFVLDAMEPGVAGAVPFDAPHEATSALTGYLMAVIAFIALFIVMRVLFAFIKHFVMSVIRRIPPLRAADKVFGLLLGAVKGLLVIFIACAAVMWAVAVPEAAWVADDVSGSAIAGWLYGNNLLLRLLMI